MRTAFTMVELIFVIVILGILAAVAIPRLNATRDDAKISRTAQLVMNGVSEIAAYAVSKGSTEDNLSLMSNSIASLIASGEAQDVAVKKVAVGIGSVSECVTIDVNTTAEREILNLTVHNAGVDRMCDALHGAVHAEDYPMQIRGASIVY